MASKRRFLKIPDCVGNIYIIYYTETTCLSGKIRNDCWNWNSLLKGFTHHSISYYRVRY